MNYEPSKGISFYQAVKEVKAELEYFDKADYVLTFNGTDVRVSFDSNPSDLAVIYDLKRKIQQSNIR